MMPTKNRRANRLLLALALLLFAISVGSASSVMFPLTRTNLDQGGFLFAIKVEHLQDGNVQFHVTVTKTEGKFRLGCSASVGTIDMTHGWSAIPGGFELTVKGKQDGSSLRYDFKVPGKNLGDPQLLFVFENFPVENMPAVELYYAKLQDFSRP